jgi:hypothetical protein
MNGELFVTEVIMNQKTSGPVENHTEDLDQHEFKLRSVAELPVNAVPSEIPSDYVVTPFGYFSPECVHEVSDDETVLEELQGEFGGNKSYTKNPYYTLEGKKFPPESNPIKETGEETDSWNYSVAAVYADELSSKPNKKISNLSGGCTVPKHPVKDAGQMLSFDMGLRTDDIDVDGKIFSVLAWNFYGESGWTLTIWYLPDVDGSPFYTPPLPVNPGDEIRASIKLLDTSCGADGGTRVMVISSTAFSESGSQQTSLMFKTKHDFNVVLGGQIEMKDVQTSEHLPPEGKMQFTDVKVFDENGPVDFHSHWKFDFDKITDDNKCHFSFTETDLPSTASDLTVIWR